ncbi:D-xylulose 5-phosphate/D-fructose 6-phosphate phosphoketolase [Cylindrobasidium torrendii FP15055 ss-10]|uniref:D-xylulose 5-phosphate/D-fructose 6-phosphate phosphoketolase n=1 Tax=Cylindrobasidium torrendii FP15055 ss-10 TaxID=1314674 RepID=A0A0D7BPC9_9AGAR|nr:D-xylulose 5-phosphate/D-fructose 6-phosphate phosphoketolase [Cylindrobasidium torrendii FP15055 ss-10]
MPGQQLNQANPRPDPSLLPDSILEYGIKLHTEDYLAEDEIKALRSFRRAADYIAAAMIFLKSNALLEDKLTKDNIKPRLLGHWGTCPGLSLVYAHLNRIIAKTDLDALYVVGPGHGAPALLASLWIEDSLNAVTSNAQYARSKQGLSNLIAAFSSPGGPPSHINAQTPGAIHEGGELGYALSVSFGAVMDKPDLVVACVVGDGEAETGPTATAWHAFKYIDPAESGAVLPIVHVNGFKISERTIYGTMDDKEMIALFTGYGYQCCIVSDNEGDIDNNVAASMEWALAEIKKIQSAARSGKPIVKPRWPVLILRTVKGAGGPKSLHGQIIEGSFKAHQVPLPNCKTDEEELGALDAWLKSYKPDELFTGNGEPVQEILSIVPTDKEKRLGQKPESYKGYVPLDLPTWKDFAVESGSQQSSMKTVGSFLKSVAAQNKKTFRIFSPDELVSNKLDAVLEDDGRNFQWDAPSRARGGRVIEILSEHTCQGMLQGYTLTGGTGLFPSYEAFLGIVHTMMVQYSKFTKMALETTWRKDIASLNYLETSTWTRQEHNGFSHQNPSFIGAVLNLKATSARVYLPPDANCFLSTMAHCLKAKNYINLMVGSKSPSPVWLSPEEADHHCIAGASVWKFASVDEGVNPDVVLVGIGCEITFEVIAAAALLRQLAPELRVRVVNVTDLMVLGANGTHPHSLTDDAFNSLFTPDRPIVVNYHGYPVEVKGLLFGRPGVDRISIHGYSEEGSTTSPFDMMLCNGTSRYDIAIDALRGGAKHNAKVAVSAHDHESYFKHRAQKDKEYIFEHGEDPEDTFAIPTFA